MTEDNNNTEIKKTASNKEEEKPIRETDITVGIRRAYNVGPYETLEIKVETTDKIRWQSVDERVSKTNGLTKLLVRKFEKSHETVFKGMDAVEKNATYRDAKEELA